jgi:hypothetical protein
MNNVHQFPVTHRQGIPASIEIPTPSPGMHIYLCDITIAPCGIEPNGAKWQLMLEATDMKGIFTAFCDHIPQGSVVRSMVITRMDP